MLRDTWAEALKDPEANLGSLYAAMAYQRQAMEWMERKQAHFNGGGNVRDFQAENPKLSYMEIYNQYKHMDTNEYDNDLGIYVEPSVERVDW